MATTAELFAFLNELNIEHSTVEHPAFFTVEEGRDWHHKIPGLHCKNLFLKDEKGKFWLASLPADKRADLNALRKRVGAPRFSFGSAETLQRILAITPGSVTPFALINDTSRQVTVVIDEDILKTEWVNFHPLHNAASTTLRSADLLKFIRALNCEPLIADCGAAAERR